MQECNTDLNTEAAISWKKRVIDILMINFISLFWPLQALSQLKEMDIYISYGSACM